MSILVRLEEERDFRKIEELTREAFWDVYHPGCSEHLIVHKIRKLPEFVKELCYVACDEGEVIGNIVYSKAKVVNEDNQEYEVLCMGPVSVLPAYQKKGIGSRLINHTIEKGRELGFKAVIIFGNPAYYQRFGFKNAKTYGITTSTGVNMDPFMALELFQGALKGITGRFYASPVYEVQEQELAEFERGFPYREKHITDTQLK